MKKSITIICIFLIVIFAIAKVFITIQNNNLDSIVEDNSLEEGALDNYSIPRLYIDGNIENMQDKEDKRKVKVIYESNNLNFESYAIIKIQGESTLRFDKKNYNITFYKDEEYQEKQKYDVKWGEFNKYTLKANWTDPLQFRNVVAAQIASEINKKYGILTDSINNGLTDGFPIEIYSNEEFLGLYTMNIHKDYLFNMDKENENNIVIMAHNPTGIAFVEKNVEEWINYEVEVGKENQETLNKLNRVIHFINDSSDEEFRKDFEKYFNLDSVLNYYCFMKFAGLVDNVTRNIFIVTSDGKVWYMVPYDFDQSWGNIYTNVSALSYRESRDINSLISMTPLWKRFKKIFKDEIEVRYKELRKDILTKENVINKMNSFYKLIPDETWFNEYARWNNKPNYEKTYLNEYLDDLLKILDKEMEM